MNDAARVSSQPTSYRSWARRVSVLLSVGVLTIAYAAGIGTTTDSEVKQLIDKLRSQTQTDIDGAVARLSELGEQAVPGLAECLDDSAIQSRCAQILMKMPPAIAAPPLKAAIERAPISDSTERLRKADLIGALGALRSADTVEFLERIYYGEPDKLTIVARTAAWALKNATGKDYGPMHNPFEGCLFRDREQAAQ